MKKYILSVFGTLLLLHLGATVGAAGHSALNGALIEGNTLHSFNLLANLFEEDNSALQTHCNTYQGAVGDVSWDVKGPLANQGNPLNPLSPKPDNRFVWECGGLLLDIRNTYTQPFSYFERLESAANTNTIVKCVQNVNIAIDLSDPAAANCVIEDPCPNPPYCSSLTTNYNNSGYALPYRNDLLNAYVRMSPIVVSDSLYLPSTTRGITLLTNRNQQADKRMLVATYASIGNYSSAQQYLQQVTGSDTETQDFLDFYTVLINAGLTGRDAYHLTAAEFAQLVPLISHNSSVGDNMKAIDHILNGRYHPLKVESGTGGRPSGERLEDVSATEGFQVLPNPFESEVRFFAPEGTTIKTLGIVDISGRVVYSERLGDSQPTLFLNTAGMPQGVLFYQCQLSDGKVLHGKIIHNSKK